MPSYIYKARDAAGKLIQGMLDAENESGAAMHIEQLGLSAVSISAQSAVYNVSALFNIQLRKVSHQETLVFTRQLSTLIKTGIPLITSLENVASQTNNIKFKQVINDIINSLKSGSSFSQALSHYPGIFPDLYVSLVRVGEAGGLLDKVLERLSELSTQDIDMRSRIRAALVYPAVLGIIAFVVVNFVLVSVLPKFVTIFEASQASLPFPTRVLLAISFVVRKFWWLLIIIVIAGIGWFRGYYRSTEGKYKIDSIMLKMPLFGPLILKVLVCRFSRSIAALTKSGVPVLEALTVVESTVSNVVLQKMIENVRAAISRGQSLTEPFRASGLFPPMVIQLINTGEKTGKLGEMFDQIASFYEPEVEFTIRNLTSLLEPIMLLVMGGVVAFIALSVLLPIFNLISIIRR